MDVDQLLERFSLEPLHEDLIPYRFMGKLGLTIHHPLVISIMHSEMMNKTINQTYLHKKEALVSSLAEQKYLRYVFLHERPYRLDALMRIKNLMLAENQVKDYWELVSHIWTDCENVFQNLSTWIDIWSSSASGREHMHDEEELEFLNNLPEIVPIWRGATHRNVKNGLSWTLDKDRAIWFSKRLARTKSTSYIAETTISKSHILAYFSGRNESEVVVLPKNIKKVKISKVER